MPKRIFLILLITFCFFLLASLVIRPYYLFLTRSLKISPLKTILSLDSLKTYDSQVTILVLGIAGENYEGGTLSDSIIVANYSLNTHKLMTISLPRDIWSDTLKDKINTAYAYGEAKQKKGGLKLAKAEIEAVVGIPIQYAAVIDFDRFKELVDLLEGIEVEVERSFVDKEFPIPGREDDQCGGDENFSCRYETVSFKKGLTRMDGETALKYVRSRHAAGPEGSDFARNRRQQKVLESIKRKLSSDIKRLDLAQLKKLYETLDQLLTRDITNQQLAIISKNVIFSGNFSQKEITLSPEFFIVPAVDSYNGQYVLIPPDGNFDNLHLYLRCERNALDSDASGSDSCVKKYLPQSRVYSSLSKQKG